MFEEYRVPDKYCGRQHGKIMWINGKKIELPDNDPGGEHEWYIFLETLIGGGMERTKIGIIMVNG